MSMPPFLLGTIPRRPGPTTVWRDAGARPLDDRGGRHELRAGDRRPRWSASVDTSRGAVAPVSRRSRSGAREDVEEYGRHSRAHASGPFAVDLVQRFVRAGEAIRLAWPSGSLADSDAPELPTAELPILQQQSARKP